MGIYEKAKAFKTSESIKYMLPCPKNNVKKKNYYLHTVKAQKNDNKDIVALVYFQVFHHSAASFRYVFRSTKARTLKKLCPWLQLWSSLVQPIFSELNMRGRSYWSRHFNISSDFFRRHSLFEWFNLVPRVSLLRLPCRWERDFAFCQNSDNFPRLKAREIIRILKNRAWNYFLISLVAIWLHIHIIYKIILGK